MTAVRATSPDLRRRVAIALATLVAALALPASASADTYCVAPATSGCSKVFPTKDGALAAADDHAGVDVVRVHDGAATRDITVPASPASAPKVPSTSFFDDVTNFMLTWLPLIFMGIICLLIGLTMRYMPRTKPQEIKPDTSQSTRWEDVAGAEEAKDELREVVEFLRDPKRFKKLGAKVPKGVLLHGPPGTGKTLLAKAVAQESGAQFFSQSASSFVEMFAGLGAARIRRLFNEARKHAPAIIFIDELDAVGGRRGSDISGEREQTLNQLLVEMDGFASSDRIVVMAASNLLEKLDSALLRPGRFDRQVFVSPPDVHGREKILKVHTSNKPLGENVNLFEIASQTSGLTGADLANIANEAAIRCARRHGHAISKADFEGALERIVAGVQSNTTLNDHERRVVAYHEAGHALCRELLMTVDRVHKISIVPRGNALGYVMNLPDEDSYLKTREELVDQMTVLLGGRVAEQLVFGAVTTGAANDLQRVSEITHAMVHQYGMGSQTNAPRAVVEAEAVSDLTRRIRDEEQQELAFEAHRHAHELIIEHRVTLERFAQELLENEVLERPEIDTIMADVPRIDRRPARPDLRVAAASKQPPPAQDQGP